MLNLLMKAASGPSRASCRRALHATAYRSIGARALGVQAVRATGAARSRVLLRRCLDLKPLAPPVRLLHVGAASRSKSGGSEEPIELSFDDHLEIVSQHLELLQRNNKFGKALTQIKAASHDSVVARWQAAASIYAMSLVHCLAPYGYTPDINSLQKYQEEQLKVISESDNGGDIAAYNRERFLVLAEMAFGVKLPEENDVDVETARKIWTELAAVMKTKEFIENVKREIKEIKRRVDAEGGDAASEEQKEAVQFMAVQTEVLKAQKDVGDKLGFKGDEGFIRMQVALMEHGMDDSIRYTASMAHHTLFHKLGLKLPGM